MNNLQLIEKYLYYIDEHLDESITFEYLAEKSGCVTAWIFTLLNRADAVEKKNRC